MSVKRTLIPVFGEPHHSAYPIAVPRCVRTARTPSPRPTAITHAWGARHYAAIFARGLRTCPVVRSRCGRARCPHRAAAPSARCAAWRAVVSGALGATRRRALRGPGAQAGGRGRTETPPAKLSTCATCHAHGTLPTRGAHGGAMGTSRPTAITHAIFARELSGHITRAARWSAAGPPGSRPTAITLAWDAHAITHAKFAQPYSLAGCARHSPRALHPRYSNALRHPNLDNRPARA